MHSQFTLAWLVESWMFQFLCVFSIFYNLLYFVVYVLPAVRHILWWVHLDNQWVWTQAWSNCEGILLRVVANGEIYIYIYIYEGHYCGNFEEYKVIFAFWTCKCRCCLNLISLICVLFFYSHTFGLVCE